MFLSSEISLFASSFVHLERWFFSLSPRSWIKILDSLVWDSKNFPFPFLLYPPHLYTHLDQPYKVWHDKSRGEGEKERTRKESEWDRKSVPFSFGFINKRFHAINQTTGILITLHSLSFLHLSGPKKWPISNPTKLTTSCVLLCNVIFDAFLPRTKNVGFKVCPSGKEVVNLFLLLVKKFPFFSFCFVAAPLNAPLFSSISLFSTKTTIIHSKEKKKREEWYILSGRWHISSSTQKNKGRERERDRRKGGEGKRWTQEWLFHPVNYCLTFVSWKTRKRFSPRKRGRKN